jgi:hypothetical protein
MNLESLFDAAAAAKHRVAGGERAFVSVDAGTSLVVDRFDAEAAVCLSLRCDASQLELSLDGAHRLTLCEAGGWLIEPADTRLPTYWLPQLPRWRRYHPEGPIEAEGAAQIVGLDAGPQRTLATLRAQAGTVIELAVWRFGPTAGAIVDGLRRCMAVETQPRFVYASHCAWSRPADWHLHLAHGHVYERAGQWPRYWRIRDELDAYAIWLICGGLKAATGKGLYRLIQAQAALSVMTHQRPDGGFRHGEWTDDIESHFRMAAGGVHLLAAAQQVMPSPELADALGRAARWLAGQTGTLDAGPWLLHDSLEQSVAGLAKSPFRHAPSRALGKSATNLLVLNTHLDSSLALMRSDEVLGTANFSSLLDAAHESTRAVLALRSAEWLYRILFPWVRLTLLPQAQARALPLPLRALKRLAWQWLQPRWHRVKARFPRLVMPGGYIERDLTLASFAAQYLPVTLWDLARMQRRRPDPVVAATIAGARSFLHANDMPTLWAERKGWGAALCYLGEALRVLATDDASPGLRADLARALVLCHRAGLGTPPGLLGASSEALPPSAQRALPSPAHAQLVVVDLGDARTEELLAVNVGHTPVLLEFDGPIAEPGPWTTGAEGHCRIGEALAPGQWAWMRRNVEQKPPGEAQDAAPSPAGHESGQHLNENATP